jgi:hypothetical protein
MARVARCVVVLAFAQACEGGGVVPPGTIEGTSRTFRVSLAPPGAKVKPLAGLDGVPAADPSKSLEVASLLPANGVRQARLPRGSGCRLTLDALHPDDTPPATSLDTVALADLDTVFRGSAMAGITVVHQAMFDVGAGACTPAGPVEKGRPVLDPDLWADTVVAVVKEMRNRGLGPGWVEFLPDAFGAGGYASNALFAVENLYSPFLEAQRKAFPADDAGRPRVMAPSLPAPLASSFTDPKGALGSIVADWREKPTRAPDALSFRSEGLLPEDHLALARAARAALDPPLSQVGVAIVGARLSAAAWDALAPYATTRHTRSAWLAAHLAVARIVLQDAVELFVADRWGGPVAAGALAGEDLFVDTTAGGPDDPPAPRALPALQSMLAFRLMEAGGATRVKAAYLDGTEPTDGHGVGVLAARSADGGTLYLLVAAADPGNAGKHLAVTLDVSGVTPADQVVRVRSAVVDATTSSFVFTGESTKAAAAGRLTLLRDVLVPSVHYVEVAAVPDAVPEAQDAVEVADVATKQ